MTAHHYAPLSLFDRQAASRRTDPRTSGFAAEKGDRKGVFKSQAARIEAAVRARPGRTPRELALGLDGLSWLQLYRRLGSLKRDRKIQSGRPRPCAACGEKCQTLWPFGGVPEEWKLASPYQGRP